MFSRLFAEHGLSLDRLRALLEVGAAGSIVKAAEADPVRQSQYSRQIKELEDFFRTRLIERQGRGTRLTNTGRELARISRFFLLGLSNFQRGCLAEEQAFRIGASATFVREFLLPTLSASAFRKDGTSYATEAANEDEIERRLHDLTLDFGIVARVALSRPLQTRILGQWKLQLWVPAALRLPEPKAARAWEDRQLPLALARKELDGTSARSRAEYPGCLFTDNFLEARAALETESFAALLPDFLVPGQRTRSFIRVRVPSIDSETFRFHLAWNPRLMRLNPHAAARRDALAEALAKRIAG